MLEIRKLLLFLFQSFNVRIFTHKYRTKKNWEQNGLNTTIFILRICIVLVIILLLEIENLKKLYNECKLHISKYDICISSRRVLDIVQLPDWSHYTQHSKRNTNLLNLLNSSVFFVFLAFRQS